VYRRFVWRRFVEETFCRGDVLSRRRFVCAPKTQLQRRGEVYLMAEYNFFFTTSIFESLFPNRIIFIRLRL
jgi:hypothetical protein